MKTTLLILFILTFPKTSSQINFQSDKNKIPLHPEIAHQIDSINTNYDFQLRFWIDGPLLPLNKKRLIIMTQRNSKWIFNSYKFDYNRRIGILHIKPDIQINNCDSVWNYFMKNHILDLPTMESLKIKFSNLKKVGDPDRIVIADGQTYSLEFIDTDKYKRLQYHCPITYNKEYPEITELSEISNIVKLIFTLAKYKLGPC